MRTVKNADDLSDRTKSFCLLQAHQNSRFFFSLLGQRLSMIATRAYDLPVINDSEAFQYVGKAVKVRGLICAVPISPLETHIYQFRMRIPQSDVCWVH